MEDEKVNTDSKATAEEPLEWHETKGEWVAVVGSQVVCTVSKMEYAPCEMYLYSIMPMQNCFLDIESAKNGAAKGYAEYKKQAESLNRRHSLIPSYFLEALKQVVKTLEATEKQAK